MAVPYGSVVHLTVVFWLKSSSEPPWGSSMVIAVAR